MSNHVSLRKRIVCATLTALLAGCVTIERTDASDWLYGIHWYGDTNKTLVEQMSGNKGIWSLETVMLYSAAWWGAEFQRDAYFNTMVSRGHTLIIRIQPDWGETVPFEDRDMDQFLADVTSAADALKNVAHIWQIGNEMNIGAEWGDKILTPEYYADMYRQIRAAIHTVDSPLGEQVVLVGAVSPGEVAGARHTDGNDYLAALCDLLSPEEVDGFSVHSYAAPWNPVDVSRREWLAALMSQLSIIQSKGFHDKPIHCTEWNRRVEPLIDSREAQSAQFLHGAFADLHAWNQLPGSMPISSACWFIYREDAGWAAYSIEGLRNTGPSGPDNDLWDAMQYACTQNYPAGVPATEPPKLSFGVPSGINVAPDADAISSSSGTPGRAVDEDLTDSGVWQSSFDLPHHSLTLAFDQPRRITGYTVRHATTAFLHPAFNTETFHIVTRSAPDTDEVIDGMFWNNGAAPSTSVTYDTPQPIHSVELVISDPGRDNRARIVEFEVFVADEQGDFDLDGYVDGDDWPPFIFCYRGPDTNYLSGNLCLEGDFDADDDIDLADVASFQRTVGALN